jgi:hypothetical protein
MFSIADVLHMGMGGFVAGLGAGLGLGIVLAIVKEARDQRRRSTHGTSEQ